MGIMLILMIGTCCYGLFQAKFNDEPTIRPMADLVLQKFSTGDYNGIYELYIPDVRRDLTKERHAELSAKFFEMIGKATLTDLRGIKYNNFNGNESLVITYGYKGEKSSSFVTFQYNKYQGKWTLNGYKFDIK